MNQTASGEVIQLCLEHVERGDIWQRLCKWCFNQLFGYEQFQTATTWCVRVRRKPSKRTAYDTDYPFQVEGREVEE